MCTQWKKSNRANLIAWNFIIALNTRCVYICAWFGPRVCVEWFSMYFSPRYVPVYVVLCLHNNKVFVFHAKTIQKTDTVKERANVNGTNSDCFMVYLNALPFFSHMHFNQCHYKVFPFHGFKFSTLKNLYFIHFANMNRTMVLFK